MRKISIIFDTRSEAIKLCLLVLALRDTSLLQPHVCGTGQHQLMLQRILEVFDVALDADLAVMNPNQTLVDLSARIITAVNCYLSIEKPDMVIAQGDATTAFCSALCAYYRRIPIGHVETGLRTGNKFSPFPEEINRVLASRVTDLYFAPTETSKKNLLDERVPEGRITVTDNTVIDALLIALGKLKNNPPTADDLPTYLQPARGPFPRVVLITGHRRESFGPGFESICGAIEQLASQFPDTHFVYPVHLNPNVQEPVHRIIDRCRFPNVHLIKPIPYSAFVTMMNRAILIQSDSGGIQEEALSLAKPVLVMRYTTVRPEVVEMGTVKLVGTDKDATVHHVFSLLTYQDQYAAMVNAKNPYVDGTASKQIVNARVRFLARR